MNTTTINDGFMWIKDILSTCPAWTLVDPNGADVAHVVRVDDPSSSSGFRWQAVTGLGKLLGIHKDLSTALAAVDNECRPCAYPECPDGICHNDRAVDSLYCAAHRDLVTRTLDKDRPGKNLLMCGCLANSGGAHRVGCPGIRSGRRG